MRGVEPGEHVGWCQLGGPGVVGGEFFAAGRISGASESGAEVAFYRQLDEMDLALALLPQLSGAD